MTVRETKMTTSGDPLQLGVDFETSKRLVNLSTRRFKRNSTPETLLEWQAILLEAALLIMEKDNSTENQEWFSAQMLEAHNALKLFAS